MAFVGFDPNKDEQEGQSQGTAQQQPPTLSSASSVINVNAVQPSSPQGQQNRQTTSGQFTNLQSYLSANKDQSAQLGAKVGSKIVDAGTQARTQTNEARDIFNTKVDQGTTISNLGQAKDDVSSIVGQAKTAAVPSQIGDSQVQRFQEIGKGQYRGPSDFFDVEQASQAGQSAARTQELAKMSETDQGRFSLLRDVIGNQNYTKGQNRLDNLLLGRTDEALNSLSNARSQVAGVTDEFNQAAQAANQLAADRRGQIDDARNFANTTLVDGRGTRAQQVDARIDDVGRNWANEYNDLINTLRGFQGGDLSLNQAQANRLGVNENAGLYNMLKETQPEALVRLNEMDRNRVINRDEQAQLAALDRLAQSIALDSMNRYTNAELAGTQTLDNAVDASDFTIEQARRQAVFDALAQNTNVTAGLQSTHGGLWNVQGDANLAQYLQGAPVNLRVNNPTPNNRGFTDPLIPQVQQNLLSQLQNILNNQGYQNRVRVK